MKFIVSLILAYIFVKVCKGSIKTSPQVYYLVATLVAVITAIQPDLPKAMDSVFVTIFYYGSFSTVCVCILHVNLLSCYAVNGAHSI